MLGNNPSLDVATVNAIAATLQLQVNVQTQAPVPAASAAPTWGPPYLPVKAADEPVSSTRLGPQTAATGAALHDHVLQAAAGGEKKGKSRGASQAHVPTRDYGSLENRPLTAAAAEVTAAASESRAHHFADTTNMDLRRVGSPAASGGKQAHYPWRNDSLADRPSVKSESLAAPDPELPDDLGSELLRETLEENGHLQAEWDYDLAAVRYRRVTPSSDAPVDL